MAEKHDDHHDRSQIYQNKGMPAGVLSGNKYFVIQTGVTLNSHVNFIAQLKKKIPSLQKVNKVEECDFILVFCPVVSRAGTDIESAEKKLDATSATKPAVLVVLHHTFDPECVVPDSCRAVTRANMVTVDCLFHEDQGLLNCYKNTKAIDHIQMQIKPKDIPFRKRERKGEQSSSTKLSGTQKEQDASEIDAVGKICEKIKELEDFKKEILGKESLQLCTNNELIITTELKLVLFGGDESTNTAAKNMIIGKVEISNAAASTASVTQQGESTQVIAGIKVMEVDLDSPELFLEELSETLEPRAFLLVIPLKYLEDKVRSEDKTQMTLRKREEIFGMRYQRYTMILFTVSDELQKKKIEEFIQSKDQRLEKVLEKCGNRYYCLNIKENGDGTQVSELLKNIEEMVEGNRNGSEKYQIISNMKERHTWIRKMQSRIHNALEKCVQFDKEFESDLKSVQVRESSEKSKTVTHMRSENKVKIEIAEQMKIMFNTHPTENRQFIKAILPGNQQPIWLSLPDEETETEKYKKLQQLDKKLSEIMGKPYIDK
ncbi:uncharacterized protein LOC113640196 [Tachysurus fulvidraco]|uniref:uncharacterized protein LOC113640196 n=1 Tax=Tachysurus fulvidraco TaxID=1234273 RepID=UPI001FED36AB|nr:uncharacterized protein LOC113640196 [Tachysurus fulvidraco]XP_047665377.1 uncharacterized protein LOC113640196 [Tachysurus fulvidraco]